MAPMKIEPKIVYQTTFPNGLKIEYKLCFINIFLKKFFNLKIKKKKKNHIKKFKKKKLIPTYFVLSNGRTKSTTGKAFKLNVIGPAAKSISFLCNIPMSPSQTPFVEVPVTFCLASTKTGVKFNCCASS